jgi:hypothetical protein
MESGEKYKILKEIFTRVNEKVSVLEAKAQGSLSID